MRAVAASIGIERLLERHPSDLSAGELERAALAKVMLTDPRILLLDEPTKGLDVLAKRALARILCELADAGRTVVIVSHDLEFCALVADEVALLFDGQIASSAPSGEFFSANAFYTTAASCITRGQLEGASTLPDAVRLTVEALR